MYIVTTFKSTYGWAQTQIEKYKPSEETQNKLIIKIQRLFEWMKLFAVAVIGAGVALAVIGAAVSIEIICPPARFITIPLSTWSACFISYCTGRILREMYEKSL